MSSPASDRPGRPPAERSDRTAQSFDERYRSASFIEEDPRRAISGLVLPSNAVGVASLQVGKAGKVTPSKASPLLPKRLQNVSDASDMNEDSASSKTPSTKRVMDIPELVRQFEDLLHDFRQDAEEHMFNVIGPNPWNLGFIQTGPLQKRAINLLKAFTRSVQLQFPKAYSLDEAMKPPTVRRFMRTCKLCLEDVGQWTQICLIHVSAFCKHEKLEQDIQHILSQGGNINARAMFEVCLQYQNRDETTSVSCSVQPIHLAVHAGNLRGVEVLLRQKAAVESRSTFDAVPDFTPLHLATALWARAGEDSLKQHEVVKLLLAQLADPNAVDLSGTTCNRLRPAASASRPQGQSGLRKGMYVTLNTEKANQIPRLRRDAKEFLQTADFSRQSEFIVVADVEDPENEHELVHIQLRYCYTDLKIQQSCVDVLGWRFFSDCCLALKDELPGSGVGGVGPGGSAELSPKFNKSHTATTWQEEDASGTSSIQLEDLRRNRAVTIHEAEAGDAPVLSEDEGEESFPHDVPWEDAIHMKLANPLRDGRFFRKRNRVVSGYLLHFAVDELVFSESELDRDVVRSIVQLRADVHSRAWVKRNISKDFFDVTAIHMAAASFSLPAVKTLLEIKASIESAATFDEIPCWTPLADALLATIHHSKDEDVQKASKQPKSVLQIKTKECVIQSLLKERANPDGCGGSGGLSCLHLAVGKNCQSEIVQMLVGGNADVTLKTSGYVRATRAHGNRGWDRGLTPLQICDYADQVYPQQARSEVMALLAPSLRGASFLLQDVTSMSAFSLSAADELVRRVVEEAEAKKEGSAARALNTLRLRAITGSKSPEGFTPLDGIAELIEIAPTTAIKMLDGLLLTEPDTEDPHVHPLPHRANMNYKHRAQGIGWSATIFDLPNLSVQTTYQPDCNIDRNSHFDTDKDDVIHQEWPCWLRQQKTWHGVLAPKASCTRASLVGPAGFEKSFADQMGSSSAATRLKYQQGDRDVCIKVLLVANILDVRILQALTNVGWSEIFAEKVVQAILSAGYENFCFRPITASLIQETVLFAAFLSWSFGCFSWQPKKTPWAVIFAIFVNESITMAWWMRGHFSHNWTLKQFFLHPMTSFRLFQLYLLWWLLWRTFFGYDLDHTWRNDEDLGDNKRTFERSLLGANLLLQCFLFIFLAKGASPRLEFGRHLLAILHSFLRLGVIFTVLFLVFASFTSAYLVMGSRLPLRALIEKVYRGLFLADGEGLDVMEGGSRHGELQPNNLDTYLTLLSTFIVTICLLNVSIAVFTMEYEAAIKESWLHFWRWRARLCTEVLLCPRWPWKFESKKSQCVERRYMAQYLEMAVRRLKDEVLPTVYNSRICQRTFNLFGYRISWERLEALDAPEDEARDEDAEYVRLVGWMTVATVTLLGVVLLFLPFVHGIFSGICLGIGFTILKSLCARGPYGNSVGSASEHDSDDEDERPRGAERPHFLWICYRADYDANVFMNKEVHKEHLDQLENRVNHMSQNLETFGHQVTNISEMMTKLAETVHRLDSKMNSSGHHLFPPTPGPGPPLDLARSSSSPQERRNSGVPVFRRQGSVMSQGRAS